ncbi:hypothetical protein BDA99DRAFT_561682 [Phascolomyces articulosus]|uniref:Uncharacterized protein n=1 Tax=Phascolomyces articulosus TaxID=60185 RepID=A0AAD5JWC0_9FUNG|nr:hypothetical protein BDA99DRAFT_561682 [Phascolomyces articulosus]
MLNNIREAVEDLQSNARNNVPSSDQPPVTDSYNQQRLGITPAPRIVQVIEGKKSFNKITIKKEHIASLVIQGSNENIEITTAEACYNTELKERSPVLETVAEKPPVSWASLSDEDRDIAIPALVAAVLDENGINFEKLGAESGRGLDASSLQQPLETEQPVAVTPVEEREDQGIIETETYSMEEEQDENTEYDTDQYLE